MIPATFRPRPIGLVVALAVMAALLSAFLLLDTPPPGNWEGKLVIVPKGSSLPEVSGILRESGILPHPLAFRALVMLTFSGRRLHYGEYAFPTPPSAFEAWRRLTRGDVIKHEVTVPPGANLYDVAGLLEEKKLATAEAFLATAASPAVLRRLEIPGESAEGYLFPDSYIFVKPVTPEEIL
ncbi:MAG TPA: endolytic transglycosylase MltG, partial [Candidatus Deferrimicrobium sp.]|nr:endolytic transglycosylase MltG [Candidatus Deferrimicrobium sp.]